MATQYEPIVKDSTLNTTEQTPRNLADVLSSGLANIANNVKPDGSDISIDVPGMSAHNVDDGFSELKGTLVSLADTFILYNVVKVGYQVLSDSNRVIIWLYTSYTDSSHYEAFRIDFNGSNHRIFFQKLVNGAETTIGYVTLS